MTRARGTRQMTPSQSQRTTRPPQARDVLVARELQRTELVFYCLTSTQPLLARKRELLMGLLEGDTAEVQRSLKFHSKALSRTGEELAGSSQFLDLAHDLLYRTLQSVGQQWLQLVVRHHTQRQLVQLEWRLLGAWLGDLPAIGGRARAASLIRTRSREIGIR